MSVPKSINDGSFSNPVQMGAAKWSYPFFDRGDSTSFEYTATFWQDQATYVKKNVGSTLGVTQPGIGTTTTYLVYEGPAQDKGNGILEVQRVYASLPISRLEGSAYVWGIPDAVAYFVYGSAYASVLQYLAAKSIYARNALWQFEYFLSRPSPIVMPQIFTSTGQIYVIGNSAFGLDLYSVTQVGLYRSPYGYKVAAQDSSVDIYRGKMYVRKTPYVII